VDLPKKNVMAALEESQAVYLFLGQEIGHDKDFQNDINLWSEHETQKPILVVKSDNQPYTLPFDKIPHREATTGLWRLLSRSIERTTLWYDQATTYRKVWLVTLVAALVLVALSALLYHRNARLLGILNQRDQSIQNQHQIASRDLQKLREVIKIAINNPDVDYSPAFSAHELKEAPELIDLFKKGSDPASKILRGRFQPTTIELLDRYDQEQPLGNLLVNALVTDLNQILGDPSLQKTPLVHSNEEIQKAIASDPKGTDLIWLNRMIMEEAYPNRIKPKSKTYLALKKTFQDALNNYALYSFNELVGRMAESQDGQGHLSFWRLSPDGAYYQQVGRSHPGEEYRVFPNTRNPIVKCAIENDAFVFWGAEQNDGDEAGWNLDGKVIGWWSNNNVSFDREYAVPRCGRVGIRGDDKTTGLLCVGVLSQPRDMGIRSAACIDVPYRNVDFLKEPGARNYLLQTVSVMHIIPNELLNFNPNPKISKDILPDQ
jgi:hypothetical protein